VSKKQNRALDGILHADEQAVVKKKMLSRRFSGVSHDTPPDRPAAITLNRAARRVAPVVEPL
jgi:hypothetical protein